MCVLAASLSIGAADSYAVAVTARDTQAAQDPPQTGPSGTSIPPEQDKPEPSPASPQTPAPATQPENPKSEKKPATAATSKKHHRKPKPAVPTGSEPAKTVVPNGSTTDPNAQIAPSLTEAQASHQRQNTTQLLASTDANLKKLSDRQLTTSQQDTVKQIQAYMEQAKVADAAGELQRARNLAFKAHLLSDELVKQ
jgi:hypothetical protein